MSHQESLFGKAASATRPLAACMHPETLDEVVDQEHLISEGKILRCMIESGRIPSMIFWGPPGVDKATLTRVIAHQTRTSFIDFSAATSGIKEIRDVMKRTGAVNSIGARTIVFINEIHHFNKAQQDAFLPFVEKGAITLTGATMESPLSEVNGVLLSCCKVFVLKGPFEDEIMDLLNRALEKPHGFGDWDVRVEDDPPRVIAVFSNRGARSTLSTLEMMILNGDKDGGVITATEGTVAQCTSRRSLLYDKVSEERYNIISALHESVRNLDPDSTVYWLVCMPESGEDPVYLTRHITRFAAENIGPADTSTLAMMVNAFHACHFVGMPGCTVCLAEAAIYLSMTPKSNNSYIAYEHAKKDAPHSMAEPVPLVTRNTPIRLMRGLDYGEGHQLVHNEEDRVVVDMQCFPDSLVDTEYYTPTKEGHENCLRERLVRFRVLHQSHR